MTRKEKQDLLWLINQTENKIQHREKRLDKLYAAETPDVNMIERAEDSLEPLYHERNGMVFALQYVCKDTEEVTHDRVSKKWYINSTIHNDLNIYERR